ncbi:MAG TPA: hypothetical protein VGF22_10740 [Acidimicrobiales bacterium]
MMITHWSTAATLAHEHQDDLRRAAERARRTRDGRGRRRLRPG